LLFFFVFQIFFDLFIHFLLLSKLECQISAYKTSSNKSKAELLMLAFMDAFATLAVELIGMVIVETTAARSTPEFNDRISSEKIMFEMPMIDSNQDWAFHSN